ncbi:MAG: enoyl-CoA hydratase-related protein [Dehalococcoidia bacterium]
MDIIIAADDAKFLPGHVQYFSVPWDIGARKTKEILYESRFIEAEEALALGFVNRVVPRTDLESETLAQAERIAETDSFVTQMIKFSVNQAQDAMGFRTAVRAALPNYLLIQTQGGMAPSEPDGTSTRRLRPVDQALRKLKQHRSNNPAPPAS